MAIRERDVKDYLLVMLNSIGAHARKIKYENRIGCPDWLVVKNGIYLVELKGPKGKLSVGQEREFKRIEDAGDTVHILMNYDDVDDFIEIIE